MTVQIEKERLDFLIYAYFGSEEDPFIACSRRAYLDLCRTIRFDGQPGDLIRTEVDNLLKNYISAIIKHHNMNQAEFDLWHRNTCNLMTACYKPYEIEFSIGQAQKWLNMTIKYLYIRGGADISSIFNYCHVPLDNYVFDMAKHILKISRPENRWSRITNYNEYMLYQNKLRSAILVTGKIPLEWEFEHWLSAAKASGRSGL